MPTSQARIPTASASKYLQQLCKHWSHNLEVEFTPQKGRVTFDAGRSAFFEAEGETLILRVEVTDAAELERTQNTVINHLKRFAFREDFGVVVWQ